MGRDCSAEQNCPEGHVQRDQGATSWCCGGITGPRAFAVAARSSWAWQCVRRPVRAVTCARRPGPEPTGSIDNCPAMRKDASEPTVGVCMCVCDARGHWARSVENYEGDGVVFQGNVRGKDPSASYQRMKERLMVRRAPSPARGAAPTRPPLRAHTLPSGLALDWRTCSLLRRVGWAKRHARPRSVGACLLACFGTVLTLAPSRPRWGTCSSFCLLACFGNFTTLCRLRWGTHTSSSCSRTRTTGPPSLCCPRVPALSASPAGRCARPHAARAVACVRVSLG